MFIHELDTWPRFTWDSDRIALLLEESIRRQSMLYGRLSDLGFDDKMKTLAENLTFDVVQSSEIEGVHLNTDEVRSSIARRLGIESMINSDKTSHYIDGVVSVMLEAMENYDAPLTKEKLCAWQSSFFPTGYSGGAKIEVGKYRTHEEHIVSGFLGRERVHYIAPSPQRLEEEMARFLDWFNAAPSQPSVICSAIAHLWFVSIHPFEDGNGRLARILGDMMLARGNQSHFKFFNISTAINHDKRHYYSVLESVQHGNGDITEWLEWYIKTLITAVIDANATVSTVLNKSRFWANAAHMVLNARQRDTLNRFLDGYQAKITSKMWSTLNKCSKDTAIRDIKDLVDKGILHEDHVGAKRPSYSIYSADFDQQISDNFIKVYLTQENGDFYLKGEHKNAGKFSERVLPLDAERFQSGDLPLKHLIAKYCSYMME